MPNVSDRMNGQAKPVHSGGWTGIVWGGIAPQIVKACASGVSTGLSSIYVCVYIIYTWLFPPMVCNENRLLLTD